MAKFLLRMNLEFVATQRLGVWMEKVETVNAGGELNLPRLSLRSRLAGEAIQRRVHGFFLVPGSPRLPGGRLAMTIMGYYTKGISMSLRGLPYGNHAKHVLRQTVAIQRGVAVPPLLLDRHASLPVPLSGMTITDFEPMNQTS